MGQARSYVRPMEVGIPFLLVAVALVVSAIKVPGFLSTGHLTAMSITADFGGSPRTAISSASTTIRSTGAPG